MALSARDIGQKRATLAVEVRAEIERMIVDGELAAGEKLNEPALSEAMGVSRGTVREAIRSLADSGLISLIVNRGAFVHKLTLAEVRNLYDLRGAIFALACAAVARRVAADEEIRLPDKLRRNLERMRAAHSEGRTERYYALNIEFHDILMQGCDNARAKTIYDNIVKEMHLYRRRGLSKVTNIARSIDEHEAILAAVVDGDPEAARAAAERHIQLGLGRYMAMSSNDEDAAP